VVGLLHHGSGPSYTNLLDENFPSLLAQYAAKVARQFPWVEMYTPVNEPLTTARFSGLYGLWYPHKQNDVSFINMLLNELMATVLAMKEIRKVNPHAKLVQTEDLGKTYSTPLLSYQATFENHRRWLTYDILCGRFNQTHPLWNHVFRLGIAIDKLQFFLDNPCPPDFIGVNHYVTSERYLDEHIEQYSPETMGGNGLHTYADVEAVRVKISQPTGLACLLKETWQRYEIPIVITEAHLNCTREEQVRWLHYVYETATNCKKEGIDIKAVTVWSLLGSFGWNKLLSGASFDYETGAFDISTGYARPTAIAAYVKELTGRQISRSNILRHPGWWHSSARYFKEVDSIQSELLHTTDFPILIVGRAGMHVQMLANNCTTRHITHAVMELEAFEQLQCDNLLLVTSQSQPWAIINIMEEGMPDSEAGYKRFTKQLGNVCGQGNIKLMSLCLDLVTIHPAAVNEVTHKASSNPASLRKKNQPVKEQLSGKSDLQCNAQDPLIIRTTNDLGTIDENQVKYVAVNEREMNSLVFEPDNYNMSSAYLQHLLNASLDLLIDNAVGNWLLIPKVITGAFEETSEQLNTAVPAMKEVTAGAI